MRTLAIILAAALPAVISAANLTATLKPSTVNLGNAAQLTIRCEGGQPPTVTPVSTPRHLALAFKSEQRDSVTRAGQRIQSAEFIYEVLPKISGRFAVPAFKAQVDGVELRSEPLVLTVLDRNGNAQTGDGATPPAMLTVKVPKRTVYLGEVFPLTMELMAEGLRQNHLPVPQLLTPGIRFTIFRPNFQQTAMRPANGKLYRVFTFQTGAVAMKSGKLNLTFEVTVTVMDYTQNVFGKQRTINLTSDPIELTVKPLPTAGRPENFSGAVGQFGIDNITLNPPRAKTGDPVETNLRLSGAGSLETISMPQPASWDGFKIHPPTSELDDDNQRVLSSLKRFKQMVIPLRPELTAIPPMEFNYFDPKKEEYISITSPATPLAVNGAALPPTPGGDPAIIPAAPEKSDERNKLAPLREQPGVLAELPVPLVKRAWFTAVPAMALLAFLIAFAVRQRRDYLQAHPAIARRLNVARVTRATLKELQDPAVQADAERFLAGVQLVLRENLGRVIDQPAEGITAETLRAEDREWPEEVCAAWDRLHEQDALGRFANAADTLNAQSALADIRLLLDHWK